MNVLVTGGAGYIGSVVAHELVKAGHKVVVYDNLSHGYRAAVPKEAEFVQGEVGDARAVTEVLRKHQIEAVMHFAALIEVGESMRVPERYFQNNTGATSHAAGSDGRQRREQVCIFIDCGVIWRT